MGFRLRYLHILERMLTLGAGIERKSIYFTEYITWHLVKFIITSNAINFDLDRHKIVVTLKEDEVLILSNFFHTIFFGSTHSSNCFDVI